MDARSESRSIGPNIKARVASVRRRIEEDVGRLFSDPCDGKLMSFGIAWEGSIGYFRSGTKRYSPLIAFKVNRPSCKSLEYLARVTGGTYTHTTADKDKIGRPRCTFRTCGERTYQILKRIPPIPNEEKERRRRCILKTWKGHELLVRPVYG